MPKWGLTGEQRSLCPWGLPADLLVAAKTITNSVEGDVYLTYLEQLIVDSPPVQRLRRVRQLGTSHLVYPDGSHNRFGHALGALRVAQDLLDSVYDYRQRAGARPDLLAEWADELDDDVAARQWAEVTVLTRVGALLHDLCHVPFGHTVEDDLDLLQRHDANGARFEHFWGQLDERVLAAISPDLKSELRRLVISKDEDSAAESASRYPFVEDLVGNTICADLLDYLPRDHGFLGLPIALGHRFREYMYITPAGHADPDVRQRVVIQVEKDGHERLDIVSELLKYLRYRYELSERVLTHHTKLAADAMIGKLLSMWRDAIWVESAGDLFGAVPEAERRDVDDLRLWIENKSAEEIRAALDLPPTDSGSPEAAIEMLDTRAQDRLESEFRTRGDDGLLENIWWESRALAPEDSRREAITVLSRSVLDRQLYKPIGTSYHEDRHRHRDAERIWKTWGSKDARRRLELQAANYIGLKERWHLVLWIPHPDMKLKLADVLVGLRADEVQKLHDYSDGCQEIYDNHERLWAVRVFGDRRRLRDDELKREVLLAWLMEQLRISRWEKGPSVPKEQLIVDNFAKENDVKASMRSRLLADVSGRGGEFDTMAALQGRLKVVYDGLTQVETQD